MYVLLCTCLIDENMFANVGLSRGSKAQQAFMILYVSGGQSLGWGKRKPISSLSRI